MGNMYRINPLHEGLVKSGRITGNEPEFVERKEAI